MNSITPGVDIIDSRDVSERIEELERLRGLYDNEEEWYEELMDEAEELELLKALTEDGERATPDWPYGAQLISEHYFEEYARELAEDLGYVKNDVGWPYTCIDWGLAARELQMDYTSVTFGDTTYWVR